MNIGRVVVGHTTTACAHLLQVVRPNKPLPNWLVLLEQVGQAKAHVQLQFHVHRPANDTHI